MKPVLTLSIVSHGQAVLISSLLNDLKNIDQSLIEVIITINVSEDERGFGDLSSSVRVIRNSEVKGFGANHNAAFHHATGRYFAIVNPDIRLPNFDILRLIKPLDDLRVGAVAPRVMNSSGGCEDSARRFPTILGLLRRVIIKERQVDYANVGGPTKVDWVAGMFVVFRCEAFISVQGFDDRRFFMYFEDVDICRRLHKAGWRVTLQPRVQVVHDAQRASRRSARHFYWHVSSAARYFTGW